MPDMEGKTIRLMINRKERVIPIDNIIYAEVTDKLCTIIRKEAAPLQLFLTIASLKAMLPSHQFLQISRSCLVSLKYFQNLDDSCVILTNDIHLPYSRRQKPQILTAVQEHLAGLAEKQDAIAWKQDIQDEFRCFDRFPFPFCILENIFDSVDNSQTSVFRYANEAFAALLRRPLHQLIGTAFASAFPLADNRWEEMFTRSAVYGESQDIILPSQKAGRMLRVLCYQPHFGFCGCMLLEPGKQA
ncbi:MAG: LytTR family transcriptional regulator DNA-binding domain-containing protein [Clostridiales bacterium]|nr:LytTR family transcriptional regulator DNA-binding domain-containing protein [Clostridiales bacterium]